MYFWVAGTDTGVGKTAVTGLFLRYFQALGKRVVPYKPVQTGAGTVDSAENFDSDTAFYQSVSAVALPAEDLNTYSFKEPASPHYAAMMEGAEVDKEKILRHLTGLQTKYECVICEGAGGLYVPVAENYHILDLIEESELPVVLTARTALGTINHTLLSLEALKNRNISVLGIVFNRFQGTPLEKDNIDTIRRWTKLPVLVIPEFKNSDEFFHFAISGEIFFEGGTAV